jgi:hypothetical protein
MAAAIIRYGGKPWGYAMEAAVAINKKVTQAMYFMERGEERVVFLR